LCSLQIRKTLILISFVFGYTYIYMINIIHPAYQHSIQLLGIYDLKKLKYTLNFTLISFVSD
jgi:hypothetical protein